MFPPNHLALHVQRVLVVLLACLALTLSCSAPVPRPVGPAADYQDAKDMVKRNRFDRALEFTDGLASATPATKFTERAQVLRVVIFAGEVKGSTATILVSPASAALFAKTTVERPLKLPISRMIPLADGTAANIARQRISRLVICPSTRPAV